MAYRDIAKRRQRDLARFHRRNEQRRAAGLCLKCGNSEPTPDRMLCEPCLEKRRTADRARTARLRAEGKPRRDPERAKLYERERSRLQHAERRAAGICTKCGLCGIPHKPHDGNDLVMLSVIKNLQFSNNLEPDHIT